jgi:hypothetical protein
MIKILLEAIRQKLKDGSVNIKAFRPFKAMDQGKYISLLADVRGPFAKFANSPYYSESELCGGAVTVSFSGCLPWQVMHFLQCSTDFSKTCCRPLTTLKILATEFHFHG